MEDSRLPHAAVPVVCFIDPVCPFAWTTSRWLIEVEQLGAIDLRFRTMSLSVLNEHRELEPWYREFNDRAWGPARVFAATEALHGTTVLRALHTAFGRRVHVTGNKDYDAVMTDSLSELALPASLADAAHTDTFDAALRAGHQVAQDAVGEETGTPVVTVDGVGFFGPVLDAVPSGEEALRLFLAVRTLAGTAAFSELKRGRRALDLS